ncbi:Atp12p [Sugiyamaella lignohabitans]|uniref:Atp12p n=1 Tax=Sugiyamaella lignohabitans TaxID=796027 RepID=A0A167FK21_9ASCO|nr:Atp12p [Sugiyamaella lignohabitans]ANB15401.1 Atp12p [Sugiyamaella lignohabitans]
MYSLHRNFVRLGLRSSSSRTVGTTLSIRAYSTPESNVLTETNRLEKTLEKFWTKVGVSQYQGSEDGLSGHVITLDSKPIKTPLGFPLVVPEYKQSSAALAHLIAQEWSLLSNLKIKRHNLPITGLASRAVDLQYSPEGVQEIDRTIELLLPYLDTDTLITFAPHKDCDGTLRPAQEELYWPVIKEAEKFWDVKLNVLDSETTLFGSKQSLETRQKVENWLRSLDIWQFTALERATTAAKSLIAGMNIVTHKRTPDEVAKLVNLETTFQTEQWGEVEDTHDVEHADIRRLLGSAYILAK